MATARAELFGQLFLPNPEPFLWALVPIIALFLLFLATVFHQSRRARIRCLIASAAVIAAGVGLYYGPFWVASAQAQTAEDHYRLGWLYRRRGLQVLGSHKQAFRSFDRAAAAGHPSAQYQVGLAYLFGRGVALDDARALDWIRTASDNGDLSAQIDIRRIGPDGTARDLRKGKTGFQP